MGGVQIKNCTAVPLQIQLCQVGVLYHDLVKPGECFTRETGAAHFIIVAKVSDKDDTGLTDTVLPIVAVVGSTLAAMVTAGTGIGLFAGLGIPGAIGPSALVAGGVVSGTGVVTEAGVLAAGGALLTKELAVELFNQTKEEHCYISSAGWYFGGENYLEIHGGPHVLASSNGFAYSGTSLNIVNKNNPDRHS